MKRNPDELCSICHFPNILDHRTPFLKSLRAREVPLQLAGIRLVRVGAGAVGVPLYDEHGRLRVC